MSERAERSAPTFPKAQGYIGWSRNSTEKRHGTSDWFVLELSGRVDFAFDSGESSLMF